MHEIRTVAIIGAGTMGHSLAQVFAQGELRVRLSDLRDDVLAKARSLIAANLGAEVEAGLLEKGEEKRVIERIQTTTRVEEACAEADFVIEAITEMRLRKRKFSRPSMRCARRGRSLPATPLSWT